MFYIRKLPQEFSPNPPPQKKELKAQLVNGKTKR
jgi:hypothetical protein